jgi:diguanylate cyclase (GGDEF)-like protein/PAS domain S-box-containing protein
MPDFRSCFFDCHGDPFFIVNLERTVVDCNPAFEKMLGRSREEIIGKKCKEVFAGLPEHNCPVSQMLVDKSVRQTFPLQLNSHRFQIIVDRIVNETGELLGFGHTVVDITKYYNDKIRDPLTGLLNRLGMEDSFDRELDRARRKNESVGVIMLDIDHFKIYNDTYGHLAGDKVLCALGKFLLSFSRRYDISCRFGGEELLIILPGTSLEVACRRAEELRSKVEQLEVRDNGNILHTVKVSLGVASFPNHGSTPMELIRAADAALYQAKAEGRNRVVVAQ